MIGTVMVALPLVGATALRVKELRRTWRVQRMFFNRKIQSSSLPTTRYFSLLILQVATSHSLQLPLKEDWPSRMPTQMILSSARFLSHTAKLQTSSTLLIKLMK